MSIDISAKGIETLRHTYGHVARRIGPDKAASRYQEAVYDVQPTVNFQYRPTWAPHREVYDPRWTAVVMEDWYALTDPRQYYYGSYTMARAKQQESMERNFALVEKRGLLAGAPEDALAAVRRILVPLRHLEWGANLNNCHITHVGYGAALTSAAMFAALDRLGIAQYITRIALLLDGNETASLDAAKRDWLEAERWQGLRHAVEDMFVLEDWFETFVAQNLVADGLIYPLIYDRWVAKLTAEGCAPLPLLTSFMADWHEEIQRWTDRVVQVAAKESDANCALLSGWADSWTRRLAAALAPIAEDALGEAAQGEEVRQALVRRLGKIGLRTEQS